LEPLAALPPGLTVETLERPAERRLGPWLLALALGLLALDGIAALALSGRLSAGRAARGAAAATLVLVVLAAPWPGAAQAPDEGELLRAATETVLAYVQTGDPRVDAVSRAGLTGLSRALFARTAIEPGEPVAVDLERDDLAVFPFLYWPITEGQRLPSDAAYARLNDSTRRSPRRTTIGRRRRSCSESPCGL
jgi:hypothetical protein